jgi:hypothetical protein
MHESTPNHVRKAEEARRGRSKGGASRWSTYSKVHHGGGVKWCSWRGMSSRLPTTIHRVRKSRPRSSDGCHPLVQFQLAKQRRAPSSGTGPDEHHERRIATRVHVEDTHVRCPATRGFTSDSQIGVSREVATWTCFDAKRKKEKEKVVGTPSPRGISQQLAAYRHGTECMCYMQISLPAAVDCDCGSCYCDTVVGSDSVTVGNSIAGTVCVRDMAASEAHLEIIPGEGPRVVRFSDPNSLVPTDLLDLNPCWRSVLDTNKLSVFFATG